jgi:hypothetical protein
VTHAGWGTVARVIPRVRRSGVGSGSEVTLLRELEVRARCFVSSGSLENLQKYYCS